MKQIENNRTNNDAIPGSTCEGADALRLQVITQRTGTIVLEWGPEPDTFTYSPEASRFAFIDHTRHCLETSFVPRKDIHPDDWISVRSAARRLLKGAENIEVTARLLLKEGGWLWCRCTATAMQRENGRICHLLLTINDADALMKAKEILAYQVDYDQLTGYGNFDKFKRDVNALLKKRGDKKYALWYYDLKNFKYINNIYGYDIGDKMLCYWARVIHRGLKEGEAFARVSSDRFTVLHLYRNKEEVEKRFWSYLSELEQFDLLGPKKFLVEITAGIYCIEKESDILSVGDMVDRANIAQNMVRHLSGSRFAFYTERMRSQVLREKAMEAEMEDALKNGEFCVYLQGQVDIQHGDQITGAEALIRWKRPDLGLEPPSLFVPLFEKNGFIVEIDHYVFEHVCMYLRKRLWEGKPLFKIAVNVSRMTLIQPDFPEQYQKIKNAYGIPDGFLELECTETVVIENLKKFKEVSARLHQYGFHLELDDFGSGYSSLNVLKDIDADVLKLDMVFFQNGLTHERERVIVSSIVAMAGALNMRVVAEGVETMQQVSFLRRIGCNSIQGFIFCRPMPMDQFSPEALSGSLPFQYVHIPPPNRGPWKNEDIPGLSLLANGTAGAVIQIEDGQDSLLCSAEEPFQRLTGYSKEEIMTLFGGSCRKLILPEDLAAVEDGNSQCLDRVEYRIRRKDGQIRWILESRFHLPQAEKGKWFAVLIDMTLVRDLESSSRKNAIRMEMLLENIPSGVCIFALEETIRPIYRNKAYCRMFTDGSDDAQQSGIWNFLEEVHPSDVNHILQLCRQAAVDHKPFELHYRLKKQGSVMKRVWMRAWELPGVENGNPWFLALLEDETPPHIVKDQLLQPSAFSQDNLPKDLPVGTAVFEVAETLNVTYASQGIFYLCGHSIEEYDDASASTLTAMMYPEILHGISERLQDTLSKTDQIDCSFPVNRDGKIVWIMIQGKLIDRGPGKYPLLYTAMLDVTRWRNMEFELKIQAERYHLLEETLQEMFFEYDVVSDVMQVTYREEESLQQREIRGFMENWSNLLSVPPVYDSLMKKRFQEICVSPQRINFDVPVKQERGEYRWHRMFLSSIAGEDNSVMRVVGRMFDVHKDVLERLAAEERAMRDQMTGLYNKVSGEMEVRRKLITMGPGRCAMCMFDLDNFKYINDNFGHAFGDNVLRKIAKLLEKVFPNDAILTRFGGDEFLAFLSDGEWDAMELAEQFRSELAAWDNGKCQVTCSIGVVCSYKHNFGRLFNLADQTMYQAKQTGKSRCVFYEDKA